MDAGLGNGHQVRLRLDAAGGLEFDGGGHLADGVAHIRQGKIIQHDPVGLERPALPGIPTYFRLRLRPCIPGVAGVPVEWPE